MSSREVARNQLTFEERAKYFKKNVEEFFTTYKNDGGGEDCIEVCLIREGRRAVVMAEEEINRLQVRVEKCEKVATLNGTKFDGMFASVTHLEAIPEFDMQSESSTDKTIATLQAEIERLKEELDNSQERYFGISNLAHKYRNKAKTAKAEAYKECIEKAKSKINRQPHSRSLEASGERFRVHKILDNLLKELVGEK